MKIWSILLSSPSELFRDDDEITASFWGKPAVCTLSTCVCTEGKGGLRIAVGKGMYWLLIKTKVVEGVLLLYKSLLIDILYTCLVFSYISF